MAYVIYNSENTTTTFNDLNEGDYFDYQGKLFLYVDDYRGGLVFDIEEGYSFYWCDDFSTDTPVLIIAPSRITVRVD